MQSSKINPNPESIKKATTEVPFLLKIGEAALRTYFLYNPGGNRSCRYPDNYIKLNWYGTKKFGEESDANQFLT